MAAPQEPYMEIQSATQFGSISPGGSFYWYNNGLTSCSVSITGNWCEQSSYGPIMAGNSVQATVKSGTSAGDYNWTSACCPSVQPVRVSGGHPFPP
jgi:hypothetical protein